MAGQSVDVPPFDSSTQALLVRVDTHPGLVERLRTFVYKAPERHLQVDGEAFRIVSTVVDHDGPLYVPASAGWDAGFLPFPAPPAQVAVDHDATVTFSVVDVHPASGTEVDGVPVP